MKFQVSDCCTKSERSEEGLLEVDIKVVVEGRHLWVRLVVSPACQTTNIGQWILLLRLPISSEPDQTDKLTPPMS